MIKEKTGGFTMVELIIFVALISLLIPVVMVAFRQGLQKINAPALAATAALIAQDKMEWFLQYGYDDAQLDPGEGNDQIAVNQRNYDRNWSVAYADPESDFSSTGTDTGYKKITVSTSTADLPQPVEIQTLLTRRGCS